MKRIILAGGGSGGHVTPLRVIAKEIAQAEADIELVVMTDRVFKDQTKFLFKDQPEIAIKPIFSGKYRRYSGKSLLWHITHLPTVLKNLRDIGLILLGTSQATWYFLRSRPDAVFCKGGYVCVPIGIAARLFRVPIIIHDSDTHPGLTNRFLSRWAAAIATGMPSKYYPYDPNKMTHSGIPVAAEYVPLNRAKRADRKQLAGFSDAPLILVTGGSTGAQELNLLVTKIAPELLQQGYQIAQVTGRNKDKPVLAARRQLAAKQRTNWQVYDFTEMLPLIQAADVIVSRAGATAMQEAANARKAVILVPSPYLTGGHQLKNAALFEEYQAAKVLDERQLLKDPKQLLQAVQTLLEKPNEATRLATQLHENFAKPQAAAELAELILKTIR